VSGATYRVVKLASGHSFDLSTFDCGAQPYNDWLVRHAENSARAGVSAVYLLIESTTEDERVVGYFAINPTQVLRAEAPGKLARGWPRAVPAWKLGKLALHLDLRSGRVGASTSPRSSRDDRECCRRGRRQGHRG
jgi:hypothetical protein